MGPIEIRRDLLAAHDRIWRRLGAPGTWLDAETRIAVARETRHAPGCGLCVLRKAALSPYATKGEHDSLGLLPANRVEMIHRIAFDPGRLTHSWYRSLIDGGITEGEYVETVSVIAHAVAVDTFARALGIAPLPL